MSRPSEANLKQTPILLGTLAITPAEHLFPEGNPWLRDMFELETHVNSVCDAVTIDKERSLQYLKDGSQITSVPENSSIVRCVNLPHLAQCQAHSSQ